ncbi:single-stranded DNA-binding protein [Bacteroides fragilis]|uniref:Single-stranded DNA-binding protein n=4 Tax=Bacteroidaceae TaxID=815 RepID=A0A6I1AWP5_PHOVU|nr:single-stranded DNA-binding protein [Bacteroides uniformis]KAA4739372.1 single-stranded DNA-binding protein [Bacteroides fragilis]KAB6591980.1 single-stranded DNA-binding protein [Phocaeicola vulgatus]KAA4761597.1 single-stranded DNA-binding protein [Bacteroides fragilis]KAA4764090.1 single-stranded DNA-binding protein [Bacteroides fragilis]KAA4769287.1 single-stranded DNA-binding protein [Bacteroides fragilis]
MKKIENTFAVTGFIGKDAEIHQFTSASVARFPLAVSRLEKNGEESNRISAFMNIEAWRKNENTDSFDMLTKGTMLTVEGYFKPEEWIDKDGTRHNRIVTVAVRFYPPVEKEKEAPKKQAKPVKKGKK